MKAQELDLVQQEPMVFVRDILATGGSRTHELYDASSKEKRPFTFTSYDIRMPIPLRFAKQLFSNEGFEVSQDAAGLQVIRVKSADIDAEGASISLRSDQVIATLDELTTDALLNRAIDKGADFSRKKGSVKRDELITFLLTAHEEMSEEDSLIEDDIEEEV